MGAARLELQEVIAGTSAEADAPAPGVAESVQASRRGRTRERLAWAAVALALIALSAVLLVQRLTRTPEPRPAAHFVLDTPEDLAFWVWSPVAVSPDGRHVALIGTTAGNRQLWLRPLDSTEIRPLAGTEGALGGHFWSPDGASIAFATGEGELRKIALASGTVQRLCKLPKELDAGHVERPGNDRGRRRRPKREPLLDTGSRRGGEAPRLARRSAEGEVPWVAAVPARRAAPPARGTGR